MYQIGDRVIYGVHGVCRVAGMEKQTVNRKPVIYLVLEPLAQDGARYLLPMYNEAAMSKLRPILTCGELDALLCSDEIYVDTWVSDENLRKQTYRELITSGDREALMRMVHTLYDHRKIQQATGKKIHLADENFLRDAEKLLASEISVVMSMELEEARIYLRNKLKYE